MLTRGRVILLYPLCDEPSLGALLFPRKLRLSNFFAPTLRHSSITGHKLHREPANRTEERR
jgi:hypothetical protein